MVQRRARTEPLELIRGHGVADGHVERFPAAARDAQADLRVGNALEEVREPEGLDDVAGADARVVRLVDEPERQDALFLRRMSAFVLHTEHA